MMKVIIVLLLVLVCACSNVKHENGSQDFNSDLVDVVVRYADGKTTQIFIPNVDDSLSAADLKKRKVILAEILKTKGFHMINSEFQLNNGCGQTLMKLIKKDCECTVFAVYEETKCVSCYRIRENIDCKRVVFANTKL